VIAAASPWSKRPDSTQAVGVPTNVTVERLGFTALRELYATAAAVVVPLEQTDFQAGITTILEAMAMAKPVVCTRTRGQTDTIVEGVTGRYVEPGDATALRSAILEVLADHDRSARLGAAAREWALEHADVGVYARRLAEHVDSAR
jgi:glycosyltransferase involved in cell wall biosynthesis